MWNMLADGERITLLDFDVANHHWFVNDIDAPPTRPLWRKVSACRPPGSSWRLAAFSPVYYLGLVGFRSCRMASIRICTQAFNSGWVWM
jgi:hypothetical protein